MRTVSDFTKQPSDNDGWIQKNASGGTWADVVAASAGNSATEGGTTNRIMTKKQGSNWQLTRAYYHFDFSSAALQRGRRLKVVGAKLVLTVTSRSVTDTNGDTVKLHKANVSHDGSSSNLAAGDFDQFSTTIVSNSEKQISSTGAVDIPIDGGLLGYLTTQLRGGGAFNVFLMNKLDYRSDNQNDPSGQNKIDIASDSHGTAGSRPKLVVTYSTKRSARDRRKGGGGGGFGEIHIQSSGISGFSGEK